MVIGGDELVPAEYQEVDHLPEDASELELIFKVELRSLYINFIV